VLFATPLLATINENWPQAKIGWLVGQHSRAALLGNPRLSALLDAGELGASHYPFGAMVRMAWRLRSKRFAAAFIPDRSPALALLALLAGIPYRAGLNSRGRGIGLSAAAMIDDRRTAKHEADLYLDVARAAGLKVAEQPRLEYHPTAAAQAAANELLASLELRPDLPFVTIHPGGGINPGANMPSKRWPVERYFELAGRLSQRANVLALGGRGDDDRNLAAALTFSPYEGIYDVAGRLDLAATGALLQRANLHVGNDTGVSHLAVAVGCHTVGIFGPTSVIRYGLYGPATQVRSVYAGGYEDGGGDTAAVTIEQVEAAIAAVMRDE
jgi:ADP-heptose:LPS heptosyltransferase